MYTAIPTYFLTKCGMRLPLHEFVVEFLHEVQVGLSQLMPNSYIHLHTFIAASHDLKISPTLELMSQFYAFTKSSENCFLQISRRSGYKGWMEPPSSNKEWHDE